MIEMEEKGKSKKFGFHLQKLHSNARHSRLFVVMQFYLKELYTLKKMIFWPHESQSEIEKCHQ